MTPAGPDGGGGLDARRGLAGAGVGALAWAAAHLWHRPGPGETGWAESLLALSALVLFPLVLRLAGRGRGAAARLWRWTLVLHLPAAVLLAATLPMAAGAARTLLSLPWVGVTALAAAYGLLRIAGARREGVAALCLFAGPVFVAVGGAWLLFARLGVGPLGFGPTVVLLTAVHFHFAGLVLPVLTGLAARETGGRAAAGACLGVLAGVPLTAVGITATQVGLPGGIEAAAVWVTVAGAWLSAWLHLRLAADAARPAAARLLWGVAGASLAAAMALALAYGSRSLAPVPWLTIPRMQALHGTLNALGFALAGTVGWTVAARRG